MNRSSWISPIWICANSAHLMLGYAYAKERSLPVVFRKVGTYDMEAMQATTGISVPSLTAMDLVLRAAGFLARKASNKTFKAVYIPHLSQMIFNRWQLLVLKALQLIGIVDFFDDGMASVSDKGILWAEGYVLQPRQSLIKWEYSFLSPSEKVNTVSAIKSYLACQVDDQARPRRRRESAMPGHSLSVGRQSLIIASKCIDWHSIKCFISASSPEQVVYVPHYQSHKNNSYLQGISSVWKPHPNIELALPSQIEEYDYCYFGVTASILYVLEVLRALKRGSEVVFIPAIDYSASQFRGEAEDFMRCLDVYRPYFKMYTDTGSSHAS